MHEARVRTPSDVIREAKVLVKVADRRGWSECVGRSRVKVEGNGRVWNFLELISEAYEYEFGLRGVQAQKI